MLAGKRISGAVPALGNFGVRVQLAQLLLQVLGAVAPGLGDENERRALDVADGLPEDAARVASRLVWPATWLRVGIAWAGSPSHAKDRFRSMPFSFLAPLLRMEGVHFYSLQMGLASRLLASASGAVTDLAPFTSDPADTAAQMAHLDLVITVDTSIAHLAGALAVPVWTLLGYAADSRWLLDRDDSPWYPTMRLFRQPSLGNWHVVMETVRAALLERVADPVHNRRGEAVTH